MSKKTKLWWGNNCSSSNYRRSKTRLKRRALEDDEEKLLQQEFEREHDQLKPSDFERELIGFSLGTRWEVYLKKEEDVYLQNGWEGCRSGVISETNSENVETWGERTLDTARSRANGGHEDTARAARAGKP